VIRQKAENLLKKVFQQKAMIMRDQYDGFCFFNYIITSTFFTFNFYVIIITDRYL